MNELYINGSRVDFADDITIKIVSNVLGDISKIESNHSYTVKLPRTLANERVMGWAARPTIDADTPRRYMTADYIVDGIAVISGGRAYISKATADEYEVALLWGDCPALVRMKDDNRKLTKLTSRDDWFVYTHQPTIDTVAHFLGKAVYGFADYISGVEGDVLPCVTVRYILALIREQYGITINIPADRLEAAGRWLVALTTRRITVDDKPVEVDTGAAMVDGEVAHTWQTKGYNTMYFYNNGGALRLRYSNDYHVQTWRLVAHTAANPFILRLTHKSGTVETYYSSNISTGQGIDVTLRDFDAVRDVVSVTVTARFAGGTLAGEIKLQLTATLDPVDEVTEGEGYRITPNLPDMTCIDFIKEVCSRLGLHAMRNNSNNAIDLLPVETITARQDQEVELLAIDGVAYAIDGWAQRNVLKYATDDFSPSEQAGAITVDNETIAKTADMFTSKFISGDGSFVPLYNVEVKTDDEGNTETTIRNNRLKPRFGQLATTEGTDRARFSFGGTYYSTFVTRWWAGMAAILERAVQVTGRAMLRPSQVAQLDTERPLYDATTNARFLLLDATSGENGIYTLNLVKI